jgi:hypothetical protein
MMVRGLVLASFVIASAVQAQVPQVEWASFVVERRAYDVGEKTKKYLATGTFDGIGMLYFSPPKKTIQFKGFRVIRIPFLGQERNDKYELRAESFTATSVISVGDGEFAFEGHVDGPYERVVTGRLRIKIAAGGLTSRVVDFRMDEHGEAYSSVMTRYALAESAESKVMLKRFDEVFFGGNFVALALPE